MGNCQAIDAATLVIQHPDGKVENMYWPIPASQIMKMNPGHYVALLITTTISHTTTAAAVGWSSVRITRIKLLRPTETLALGHVYRLISTQGSYVLYMFCQVVLFCTCNKFYYE